MIPAEFTTEEKESRFEKASNDRFAATGLAGPRFAHETQIEPSWACCPVDETETQPAHRGRTGAITRDAWVLSWYTVLFATTVVAGGSMVRGSPVFGFGS